MTSQLEAGRPLRADAARNRERIIDAARRVFGDRGVEAQMDDVAERAEVGVGTVYRHFPTKEALMGELVRQKFAAFGERAAEALASDAEPFEALAVLLRGNCEAMARDAATRYSLQAAGEAVWSYAEDERERLIALTDELIGRARRAGTLRADVRVEDIPMIMCGVSATMGRDSGSFDWHRHLELLIDALRAR